MFRPGLYPPLAAVRINNNLLSWSSVSDPSRDCVDSFSPSLRSWRNVCEFDGWNGTVFLGAASVSKAESRYTKNKDERPCELLQRSAYIAPCDTS
jgi:hypothetical protein